jgi:GrpB-like predicted nucleotidyltransferase (UPF0157 family)
MATGSKTQQAIRIRPVADISAAVETAFRRHRAQISELVPDADVVHVGSTAVPGTLTKGDLDLLVRVAAGDLESAVCALRTAYAVHQPENWTASFASFVDPKATDPPVGVQVVVRGSDEEPLFEPFIEALTEDFRLVDEYNALKTRLDGADYERYTREKGEFIERVLKRRNARLGRL